MCATIHPCDSPLHTNENRMRTESVNYNTFHPCRVYVEVHSGRGDFTFSETYAPGLLYSGMFLPWQCLYFFPLPQGHGSFRPTFFSTFTGDGLPLSAAPA